MVQLRVMSKDEINKRLRALSGKIESQLDQRLANVRREYEGLEPDERNRLRTWAEKLAELTPPNLTATFVQARVEFLIKEGTGPEDGVEPVYVSAESLLRAIDAWGHRKDFVPGAFS